MAKYNLHSDNNVIKRLHDLHDNKDLTQQKTTDTLYISRRACSSYENGVNSTTLKLLL